jgi:hypothetical protein
VRTTKMVRATMAQIHLQHLSDAGVGRKSVAEASDLNEANIRKIRQGRRRFIKSETERRILNVTVDAYAGASKIPAYATWKKINALLGEGFTRTELAIRLGYNKPELRMGRKRITGTTAVKVNRFYQTIMAGGEEDHV